MVVRVFNEWHRPKLSSDCECHELSERSHVHIILVVILAITPIIIWPLTRHFLQPKQHTIHFRFNPGCLMNSWIWSKNAFTLVFLLFFRSIFVVPWTSEDVPDSYITHSPKCGVSLAVLPIHRKINQQNHQITHF